MKRICCFLLCVLSAINLGLAENHVSIGVGHMNSYVDFYHRIFALDSLTNASFSVNHNGQWGLKTLSETKADIQVEHSFLSNHLFYSTAEVKHTYFSRYGCYFVDSTQTYSVHSIKEFKHPDDTQHQWEAELHLGCASNPLRSSPITYQVQADYYALYLPPVVTEHQMRYRANVRWEKEQHAIGCNMMWQSDFYVFVREYMPRDWWNYRHNFRSEPYYEYTTDRVRLHIGAHLDANFGRNNSPTLHTSQKTDLGVFCPSPNIQLHAVLVPSILDMDVIATGRAGWGSLQNYMKGNRYYEIVPGVKSHHVPTYVPINASVGLTVHPVIGLDISVLGGYLYSIGDGIFEGYSYAYDYGDVYPWLVRPGYFNNYCIDIDQWRICAELKYVYQNRLELKASGNYYFWHMYSFEDADPVDNVSGAFSSTYTPGMIYDRPDWEASFSLRGRITPRWSIYSSNTFRGKFVAWIQSQDKVVPATIDLNIGTDIQTSDKITVFAELRNLLNRKNYIFYGYQTQGINCLMGIKCAL